MNINMTFCISYAADLIPLEDLFGTHSFSQSFTHFNHPKSIRMNGITVTDPDRVLCHRTHTRDKIEYLTTAVLNRKYFFCNVKGYNI